MDHTDIDEQHLIDRYVRGTLPAEEAARFEEHYLSCQDCLDRLDLAESMKRGFQRAAGQDAARVTAARQLAIVAWLARLGRSRQAAVLAMALLVAVLLPWGLAVRRMADRDRKLAQERAKDVGALRAELEASRRDLAREKTRPNATEPLQPQGNVPILFLDAERGGPSTDKPTVSVHLPSSPGWIFFSLAVDTSDQLTSYGVILQDAGGRVIWHGADLRADHDNLNLSLPSTQLAPGDYTLAVEGLAPGRKPAAAGRFVFRVLPAG